MGFEHITIAKQNSLIEESIELSSVMCLIFHLLFLHKSFCKSKILSCLFVILGFNMRFLQGRTPFHAVDLNVSCLDCTRSMYGFCNLWLHLKKICKQTLLYMSNSSQSRLRNTTTPLYRTFHNYCYLTKVEFKVTAISLLLLSTLFFLLRLNLRITNHEPILQKFSCILTE